MGESRVVILKDKSVIELNTQTEVSVTYSASERQVKLIRGEALFEVAKNPNRPFIVSSGGVVARAVGTKFSVSRLPDGGIVTVAEGRVAVTEEPDPAVATTDKTLSIEIAAGQQAIAASHSGAIVTGQVNVDKILAWRDGRLVFDDDRLADVVREFNRYNSTQIVIADPDIAERRIYGVFRTRDPESLVTFLEKSNQIMVRRGASDELVLSDGKKPSGGPIPPSRDGIARQP
jgi:transmembrane sensor